MKPRMTRSSRPSRALTGRPFARSASGAASTSAGTGAVPRCVLGREGDKAAGRQLDRERRAFVERQAAHRVDREVGAQLLVAERRAAEPRAPERAQELHLADDTLDRSAERRVGTEGVSTGRSRWAPSHYKK